MSATQHGPACSICNINSERPIANQLLLSSTIVNKLPIPATLFSSLRIRRPEQMKHVAVNRISNARGGLECDINVTEFNLSDSWLRDSCRLGNVLLGQAHSHSGRFAVDPKDKPQPSRDCARLLRRTTITLRHDSPPGTSLFGWCFRSDACQPLSD